MNDKDFSCLSDLPEEQRHVLSEEELLEIESFASTEAGFSVRTDIRSANYGPNSMNKPSGIMLHHTAGSKGGDIPTLTRAGTGVSSNDYITKEGVIYEFVPFPRRAWHAGERDASQAGKYYLDGNTNYWGIEIENKGDGFDPYTKAQIDAIVWRCRQLAKKWGLTSPAQIFRHRDFAPSRKTDTSNNFPFEEVRRRILAKTDDSEQPQPGEFDVPKYTVLVTAKNEARAKAFVEAGRAVGLDKKSLQWTGRRDKALYASTIGYDSPASNKKRTLVADQGIVEYLDPRVEESKLLKKSFTETGHWNCLGIGKLRSAGVQMCKNERVSESNFTNKFDELVGEVPADPTPTPEKPSEGSVFDPKTPRNAIKGKSRVPKEKVLEWLTAHDAHKRVDEEWVDNVWKWGTATGIRPDFLIAQEMLETAWGHYGGRVTPEMNNVAGIKLKNPGPIDNRESHEVFKTRSEGIRAHANHLCAYCGNTPVKGDNGEPVHDRYYVVKSLEWAGTVQTIEGLSGRYAPRLDYADFLYTSYLDSLSGKDKASNGPGVELPKKTVWGIQNVEYLVGFGYASQWQGSHKGEDVVAPTGTAIQALSEFEVLAVWNGGVSGYNQCIIVHYPKENVDVLYGHVGRNTMKPKGYKGKMGDVIARVGTYADAANTDPHAHVQTAPSSKRSSTLQLGTAFNNVAVDPRPVRIKLGEKDYRGMPRYGPTYPASVNVFAALSKALSKPPNTFCCSEH